MTDIRDFLCNKLVGKAKNGADRGICEQPLNHRGTCTNFTCWMCGVDLYRRTLRYAKGSGYLRLCQACNADFERKRRGATKQRYQIPGSLYKFPCGCEGILPKSRGGSNQFVFYSTDKWHCRIKKIIRGIQVQAKVGNYAPIDPNTPCEIIRKLMDIPNCERCEQRLDWELGPGKTPHLHHNHSTGEIYGFTHARCNPNALEIEVDKLKEEIRYLKINSTVDEPCFL